MALCYKLCGSVLLSLLLSVQFRTADPVYKTEPKFFSGNDGSQLKYLTQGELEHLQHLVVEITLESKCLILDLHLKRNTGKEIKPWSFLKVDEVKDYLKCDDEKKLYRYDGKIRNADDSLVTLIICEEIWGVIRNGDETFIITNSTSQKNKNLINFDHEMLIHHRPTPVHRRNKRETAEYNLHHAFKANKASRYIELGMVVDQVMLHSAGDNKTVIIERCVSIVNKVNSIFQDYNIFIALVDLKIWTTDVITIGNENITSIHNSFGAYVKTKYEKLIMKEYVDHVTLILGEGYEPPLAFIPDQMCDSPFSIITDNTYMRDLENIAISSATILARQVGINYEIGNCSDRTSDLESWKLCAAQYLSQLNDNISNFTCLDNKPTKIYGGGSCGNGFIDPGEDCDCGLLKTSECRNLCCDVKTCKLSSGNHECATGECCNLDFCKIKTTGTVCRPKENECDSVEVCDGKSQYCPADEFENTNEWNSIEMNDEMNQNIRGPYNANKTSLFIELALIIDNALYKLYDKNITRINEYYTLVTSLINSFFQQFNVFVALVNIEIWSCEDEINVNRNIEITYDNFGKYAETLLNIHIDHLMLLSGIEFRKSSRTFNLNSMCTSKAFSVTTATTEFQTKGIMQILAQNLGVPYDGENCKCSLEHCLMGNGTGNYQEWSNCSIQFIKQMFSERENFFCLKNEPIRIFGESVCGNSFVEPGEECDCGLPYRCDNKCCNAKTCKLNNNASCGTGECCDLKTCEILAANTSCRASSQECDPVEYCDGESEYCPVDKCENKGECTPKRKMDKNNTYSIRGPYSSNENSRYIKLALVIDNAIFESLDKNITKLIQRYKDVVNLVNSNFQPFNIFIALVQAEIWSCHDDVVIVEDTATTFENFAEYAKLKWNEHIDHFHLISGIQSTFINRYSNNSICTSSASGVSRDHDLTRIEPIAQCLLRSLARGMNIPNDDKYCTCKTGECIMSEHIHGFLKWSNCSIKSMTQKMNVRDNFPCLYKRPTKLYDGPVCGNTFVEPGEDCDCGLLEKCSPCCNSETCKFINAKASCAFGECCDLLKMCQIRPTGSICRPAVPDCDLAEHCDGKSEYCPKDVFKNVGETCSKGPRCDMTKLTCTDGLPLSSTNGGKDYLAWINIPIVSGVVLLVILFIIYFIRKFFCHRQNENFVENKTVHDIRSKERFQQMLPLPTVPDSDETSSQYEELDLYDYISEDKNPFHKSNRDSHPMKENFDDAEKGLNKLSTQVHASDEISEDSFTDKKRKFEEIAAELNIRSSSTKKNRLYENTSSLIENDYIDVSSVSTTSYGYLVPSHSNTGIKPNASEPGSKITVPDHWAPGYYTNLNNPRKPTALVIPSMDPKYESKNRSEQANQQTEPMKIMRTAETGSASWSFFRKVFFWRKN